MIAVIAIDGSHASLKALRTFLDLAEEFAKIPEVHVVTVADYADVPDGLGKAPKEAPDLLASEAETALVVAAELTNRLGAHVKSALLRGHTVDEVLRYARAANASMIVVGTHGRKGINRAILGSTCEGIIRRSEFPVLSVRHE